MRTALVRLATLVALIVGVLAATPVGAATTTTIDGAASCTAMGGYWDPDAADCHLPRDYTVAAGDTLTIAYGTYVITNGTFTVASGGTLNINGDSTLRTYGGLPTNAGTININSGEFGIVRPMTNTATGTIVVGSQLFVADTLTNNGTISVLCGGSILYGDGNIVDNPPQYQGCTVPDTTAPTASPTQSPAANGAGWNTTDVTVTWHWADNAGGSGIAPVNCTTSSTSSGAGSITLSATCKDVAGNTGSASYTVKVDKTAPTLAPTVVPNPVLLGGTATAIANASDATSGIATQSCGPIVTSSVGTKTVTCTATDHAGNTNSATAAYIVGYKVCLLYDPTKSVKAGATIPLKVQLCDANGANVSSSSLLLHATGLTQVDSSASATVVDTGNANPDSDFRYDSTLRGYIYNLKTTGLAAGTWKLSFTVTGDPTSYSIQFDVR